MNQVEISKKGCKERESMIDLSVNQIVNPPVKCWVRDDNEDKWRLRWLVAIVNKIYYAIENIEHCHEVTLLDAFKYGGCAWQQCSLTDPTIPTKKIKKWLTVEDVPVSLWNTVLFKFKNQNTRYARTASPCLVSDSIGNIHEDLVYLPLGQPLTSEWLPFESEVVE